MYKYTTYQLFHEGNELKHNLEQDKLIEWLDNGYEIVSTASLPDRIVYVLRIQGTVEKKMLQELVITEEVKAVGSVLKEGVKITKNGKYYIPGKGFLKKGQAYE